MQELRFDNRVAVVTGAGRGLGRAYAEFLASKGAKVVVNDNGSSLSGSGVDTGPTAEVVQGIKAAGGEAVACTESVATSAGGKAIVQAALDHFGRIDIIIHNAGNARHASMKEMTDEDFNAVLDVHLRGAWHVVRPAFPIMCAARYGRIVLTSSIGGLYGNKKVVNYGVSKAGIIGLNNVVALEGASENVLCNIIAPGAITRISAGIDTSSFPPTMKAEVVAPVVGWLSHETCSVNGEMFIAMAGRVARCFLAETQGVFSDNWTMEEVAKRLDEIRDTNKQVVFPVVPDGHAAHVRYSFEMAGADTSKFSRIAH